jgi:hypothetical protein
LAYESLQTDSPNDSEDSGFQLLDDSHLTYEQFEKPQSILPTSQESFRVYYSLDKFNLGVRVVPSDVHGATSHCWDGYIGQWGWNNTFPPSDVPSFDLYRKCLYRTRAFFADVHRLHGLN